MARAQKAELQVESMKMNRVRPGTNAGFNLLFTLLAAMAIIPVLFVFMISISSEESIRVSGTALYRRASPTPPTCSCGTKGRPSCLRFGFPCWSR